MKKILIGLISLFALCQMLFAQPLRIDKQVSNVGVCMGTVFLPAMTTSPMMLIHVVGAANGDDAIRKTIDGQIASLGVDPIDADYFFLKFRQIGKSLQESVADQPSIEMVRRYGLDTLSNCMTRLGVSMDDKSVSRCVALGNLGFNIAYLRLNAVAMQEVKERFSTSKEPDELFKSLAQGMVDRVFDQNSRISRMPESAHKAALLLVSQDEFSRCIDASK
jgi:hypothetical protein